MNYQIIKDETIFKNFIDWLPDLDSHEKYYISLFARKKYDKSVKEDKAPLKRIVTDKDRMFDKVKQMEVELGAYKSKGIPVSQEALALYITPNPRDLRKATFNLIKKLTEQSQINNFNLLPHSESLSQVQKAKSRTCFIDFDVDFTTPDYVDWILLGLTTEIKKHVNIEAVSLLKTKGGVHILIDPKKVKLIYKNTFYKNLSNIASVDQTGDQMIPVPGCIQGNFIPHFINISNEYTNT